VRAHKLGDQDTLAALMEGVQARGSAAGQTQQGVSGAACQGAGHVTVHVVAKEEGHISMAHTQCDDCGGWCALKQQLQWCRAAAGAPVQSAVNAANVPVTTCLRHEHVHVADMLLVCDAGSTTLLTTILPSPGAAPNPTAAGEAGWVPQHPAPPLGCHQPRGGICAARGVPWRVGQREQRPAAGCQRGCSSSAAAQGAAPGEHPSWSHAPVCPSLYVLCLCVLHTV
jgi:hypothetical protein